MKQQPHSAYSMILLLTVVGAVLRFWQLKAAVDDSGLPVMHLSVYLLLALIALVVLIALFMSIFSRRRVRTAEVLRYDTGAFADGVIASILILVGAAAEFAEELVEGPTISTALLLLASMIGGFCCIALSWLRRRGNFRYPAAELIPIAYLLVVLVLNFRRWSIDPIIADYFVVLFALIFSLLAFYYAGGYIFGRGKPGRTLFCVLCAVFFCGTAVADGLNDLQFSTILTYAGLFAWQLPVLRRLLTAPPAPQETEETEEIEN